MSPAKQEDRHSHHGSSVKLVGQHKIQVRIAITACIDGNIHVYIMSHWIFHQIGRLKYHCLCSCVYKIIRLWVKLITLLLHLYVSPFKTGSGSQKPKYYYNDRSPKAICTWMQVANTTLSSGCRYANWHKDKSKPL